MPAPVTKSAAPTRKLSYAAITGLVIFIVSQFTSVDKELEQAINIGVPLVLAYFVSNNDTPGGVPVKTK